VHRCVSRSGLPITNGKNSDFYFLANASFGIWYGNVLLIGAPNQILSNL